MKRKLKCLMVALLAALLICGLSFAAWTDTRDKVNDDIPAKGTVEPIKIPLTSDMVINETAQGDAGMLVDEQDIAGDPPTGDCITNWNLEDSPNRYFEGYLPMNAIIDLGGIYEITDVYLYDGKRRCTFTVSYGEPFSWTTLFTYGLGSYKVWHHQEISPTVQTRYLQISKDADKGMHEIVIYGTLVESVPTPTPSPKSTQFGFTVEEAMGTNAFIDDPYEKIAVVGSEREYHFWDWDEGGGDPEYPGYPDNENKWQPSWPNETWLFDTYYGDLSQTYGITIGMCLQDCVAWIDSDPKNKPLYESEDSLDPASYIEHGDHMFQYAARYASVKVSDSLLKLAPGQPRETGLGYLEYYENWNEEDRYWDGRDAYFTPYEYAAMSSADYDGHCSTLGTIIGVKNADSNAKLVMGGIANPSNPDYVKAIKFWCDWNRSDSKFVFDVINLHVYCSDGSKGISPEADNLRERLEEWVDYRDVELPGVEVWLTEFGWDTYQGNSYVRSRPIGSYDEFEVQAQWIIRGYLAALAAGVDRPFQYMLRDVDSDSSIPFFSCGLVTEPPDWTPKKSWYYVYTMRNRLTGMEYWGEQDSGNSDVWIYKFKARSGNDGAYVLWCPTSDGTTVDDYELTLAGSSTTATLVEMVDEDTDGVETSLTISSGKVAVDVSERPIFVLVNDI